MSGIALSIVAFASTSNHPIDYRFSHCEATSSRNLLHQTPSSHEKISDFAVKYEHEENGLILNNPKTKAFSIASYRANLPIEDKYDVRVSNSSNEVFALVLDGHGGWQVSEYGRKVLIENVRLELEHIRPEEENQTKAVENAIENGFLRTDRDLVSQLSLAFKLGFGAVGRCGSCALLAYVRDNTLVIANAGDIRAVLGHCDESSGMKAIALSSDHNAMALKEQNKLITEHPGEDNVFNCRHPSSCYVKGVLQPTRSLGDFALKYSEFNGPPYRDGDRSAGRHISAPYTPPYITALPEIRQQALTSQDKFVIIGTDGLWDYLSNEEAVEIVQKQINQGNKAKASSALVEKTLEKAALRYDLTIPEMLSLPPGRQRRTRHDDTTVVVLFFE